MRYSVIAIEREYASGGLEIGEKLADRLGIPCYGQKILEMAAENLNMPIEQLREVEEGINGSLLFGLVAFANLISGQELDLLRLEQKLAISEAEVVRQLSVNPCVLIGRGAAALLNDNKKALKVFIHADNHTRIERAIAIYGLAPNQAESSLQYHDKRRANYHKATTEKGWKDPDIYHIFLNSGQLGIERVVDILEMVCL
jgi:cytidylate kinase